MSLINFLMYSFSYVILCFYRIHEYYASFHCAHVFSGDFDFYVEESVFRRSEIDSPSIDTGRRNCSEGTMPSLGVLPCSLALRKIRYILFW